MTLQTPLQTETEPAQTETIHTRSVVVPVYAEYPRLWVDFVNRLLDAGWDEVIVAADKPDEPNQSALNRIETNPRVHTTVSNERRGKGGALLDGLSIATGTILGFVDADGAISEAELGCIYRMVGNDDADVAIGSRSPATERRKNQSVFRRLFAAGYSALARLFTGVPVNDFQCGAKAFSREAWEEIEPDIQEHGFAFDTQILARFHSAGFQIREVSIEWNDPGESHVRLTRDVPAMFKALWRIRRTLRNDPADTGVMKLALVSSHPPGRGHLAEYTEELANAYGQQPDIELTVLAQRVSYAPSVEHRGTYTVRRLWARNSFGGTIALLRELLTGSYDAIHFNIHMTYFGTKNRYRFFGLLLPPLMSRFLSATVVTTLHDLLEVVEDEVIEEEIGVIQSLGAIIATQLVLLSDAITVTSEDYLDIVTSRYKVTNVHHIGHGTFNTTQPNTLEFEPPLRILVFGHLSPMRDISTVVDAADRVQQIVPDAELWIAGDSHPGYPGYREQLEKQFASTPGVRFTGYVEEYEMDELWETTTVLVMPYRTCTGVSGVFQLAKTYGRPVIAFDVDGIRTSTVETGGTAVFIQPDADELATSILRLWDNPTELYEMARTNLAASNEFTIQDAADELIELLATDNQATSRLTGPDLIYSLDSTPCPDPDCNGSITQSTYKETDALVCEVCQTPAIRIWGDQ